MAFLMLSAQWFHYKAKNPALKFLPGLLVGYEIPVLTFLSASGLTLLMLSAFIIRMKIKDSLVQCVPALVLLVINLYIAIHFLLNIG